jgi:hypothetical protein
MFGLAIAVPAFGREICFTAERKQQCNPAKREVDLPHWEYYFEVLFSVISRCYSRDRSSHIPHRRRQICDFYMPHIHIHLLNQLLHQDIHWPDCLRLHNVSDARQLAQQHQPLESGSSSSHSLSSSLSTKVCQSSWSSSSTTRRPTSFLVSWLVSSATMGTRM